jgi:phospholipid/cholesterol/gamma-HCH transport system substrate-binding protein
LGDRYLEISSGSPASPQLPPGSVITGREPTDMAAVLARGGDAMTNVLAISTSLRQVLERIERGEGVLGELTANPESGRRVVERLDSVLVQTDALLKDVRAGKGVFGRLVSDPKLEAELVDNLSGFTKAGRQVTEALTRDLQREDSVVAGLLRDPKGRERLQKALDGVGQASAAVAAVGNDLAEGKGTLPRFINDEEYAKRFLDDLSVLTYTLRTVAEKLDHGQGGAARLINDPTLVKDLENLVRGVENSRLAKWYVRNRRDAGERAAPTPTPRPTAKE